MVQMIFAYQWCDFSGYFFGGVEMSLCKLSLIFLNGLEI